MKAYPGAQGHPHAFGRPGNAQHSHHLIDGFAA